MPDPFSRFTPEESAELLVLAEQIGRGGVIDWDVRTNTVRLSASACAMYGLETFDGNYANWIGTVHPEDRPRVSGTIKAAFAAQQREFALELRVVRPIDNQLRWLHARRLVFYENGEPVRVVGVSVDITEQKQAAEQLRAFTETLEQAVKERTGELEAQHAARLKAEEQLRQAQKMEAVGQLTGGVAHDFNNLLTIILGGLDSVGRQLPKLGASPESARIARAIEMARQGARRAAILTNRLLAFSRQQPLMPKPLDANKLTAGMSELLRGALGETVVLETVLAGGLWLAFADENQLENAILNLATNARDAMPEGGKLTIETANTSLDESYTASVDEPVVPGQYVMIAVADTGTGMGRNDIARAFEPFYTTKDPGKGTGLGLSQVYGFVRQSAGHVRIYSELGEGTTVKIYLPRFTGKDDRPAAITAEQPDGTLGGETILVVEDDEALRLFTVESLKELGYRVLEANNAAAALAVIETGVNIAMLFTDIVMPGGMNGRQLADEVVKRRPTLKVLYTTGYTRNAIIHHGRLDLGVELLGKPFSFEELGAKVRAVFDKP